MVKMFVVVLLIISVFAVKCTESIGGHGDCFSFTGITYNAVDSSKLQDVTVYLTDFTGHFEKPISGVSDTTDSNGYFHLFMCPGYREVTNWRGTEIYKFDSCKAVFFKNGYISDSVVIRNSDTTSTYIQNVYLMGGTE